ncbi:hypothetical protein RRG08_056286 [Elysia crispata]|uniref:Uncharacterized protein n=1 Tax=Elysia crispata TaxID=231223 RepID=A0AAE1E5P7_9GAST|nr:hypothetical protein RRG08_056286 [Elysia crispata]
MNAAHLTFKLSKAEFLPLHARRGLAQQHRRIANQVSSLNIQGDRAKRHTSATSLVVSPGMLWEHSTLEQRRRHVELPAAHGMRCKRARCSCGRRVWLSCDQPPALILPADWHRADTAVRRPRDTEMNRGYRKEEWRKEVP